MSDRVTKCPSCNYSGTPEVEFEICPRCGLIITKYFQRLRQSKPESEIISSSTIVSSPPLFNQIIKLIAAGIFGALVLFIAAALINKCFKSPSGTIIWTKDYYPNSSDSTPSFVHGLVIGDDFLNLVGSFGRSDIHTSQWSIQRRRLSDGTLVPTFGEGGLVRSSFGSNEDYANGVAVDSQHIYIIGMDRTPWGNDRSRRFDSQWRIEKRRLSDGSLVEGFGEKGVVVSDLTPYYEKPEAIIIDADYMYIAGIETIKEDEYHWRIEKRRLSDGSLVLNFGIGGIARSNSDSTEGYVGTELVNAMAIGDGYLYVVGRAYNLALRNINPSDTYWRIEKRRLEDGSLVEEFGTHGLVANNPSQGSDEALGIAIDDRSMFIVGFDTSNGNPLNTQWRVEKRSLFDGTLLVEFGKDGVVTNNSRAGGSNGIVLEQEPSIWKKMINLNLSSNQRCMYLVGVDIDKKTRIQQWRIEKRRINNGAICSDFGNNGVVDIDPGVKPRIARLIAADSNYIYVAAHKFGSNTSSIIKVKK